MRPRRSPRTSAMRGTRAPRYNSSSVGASNASRSSRVPENGGLTGVVVSIVVFIGASTYEVVCEVDFSHTVAYVNGNDEVAQGGHGRDARSPGGRGDRRLRRSRARRQP